MAEYSPDDHRLLILPDHRQTVANVDLTNSTFTQFGPHPGVPEAQQNTEMVLESSGSQSGDSTLEVMALKGGLAGKDNLSAGFCWRQDGDSNWRGYDPPQGITSITAVNWNLTAGSRNERGTRFPDGVVRSDGTVVAVTCDNNGTTSYVASYTQDPTTYAWTSNGSYRSEASDGTHELHPCVCLLPNGRILSFSWTYDASTSLGQVRMDYTDDNGANWELGSRYTLQTPIDTSTYKIVGMRCAYNGGQVCLIFITSGGDYYWQYASDSLGTDLVLVESTSLASTGANVDVEALPSGTGFILSDDTATVLSTYAFITIGSAFQLASTGTGANAAGTFSRTDGAQFCVDDNGTIYAYGLNRANEFLSVAASYDEGATWVALGDEFAFASAIATWSTGHYPDRYSTLFHRGRVMLLHNFEATGGTVGGDYDNSFVVSYHGGYTDITLPPQTLLDNDTKLFHWTVDWVPYNLPGDMVWTAAGTSTTEALIAGTDVVYLDLQTAAGNTRTFTYNVAGGTGVDLANGMGVLATFQNNDVSGVGPSVRIQIDDASDEFEVEIRHVATNLVLYDVNGTATLATAAAGQNTFWQVMMWVNSDDGVTGNVTAWYREWTQTEDREWSLLGTSTALARAPGGPAQNFSVTWGQQTAEASASKWVQVSFAAGQEVGLSLVDGFTNPDDLALRRISSLPTYIDDGVRLQASDGPAFAAEEWEISSRYDYPWQNVMPTESPSPNTVWRSEDGTTNQDFVFTLTDIAGEGEDWNNDIFALAILNTNAYRIRVDYETTPGGGYTNLVNSYLTATVNYTRAGKSVEITSHTIGDPFNMLDNELVGCSIVLDTAGTPLRREVTRNTYGYVPGTAGTSNKRPRLYCDDIDGTEATSGQAQICYKNAMFFQSLRGAQMATLRVRFEYNPYTPAMDYLQCGTMMFGPAYVFGWQPSQTRGRSFATNVDLTTGADGRRAARKNGPMRRTVALTWTEGVDETQYLAGTDDYIESSSIASAEVVAERHDVPKMLMGVWSYLDGPAKPVVYFPRLPKITASSAAINNRFFWNQAGGAIYGRITGELNIQTLIGSEEDTEVLRIDGLTIEEEN